MSKKEISLETRKKISKAFCGCPQVENGRKLDVHHIDYDKLNTKPSNNIALCMKCNAKVNSNREQWTEYFKKMIKKKYARIK